MVKQEITERGWTSDFVLVFVIYHSYDRVNVRQGKRVPPLFIFNIDQEYMRVGILTQNASVISWIYGG